MLMRLRPRIEYRDHEYYYIEQGSCRVGWAKVSHGSSGMPIYDGILSRIAESLGLCNPQLKEYLVEKHTREEYIDKVCGRTDSGIGP